MLVITGRKWLPPSAPRSIFRKWPIADAPACVHRQVWPIVTQICSAFETLRAPDINQSTAHASIAATAEKYSSPAAAGIVINRYSAACRRALPSRALLRKVFWQRSKQEVSARKVVGILFLPSHIRRDLYSPTHRITIYKNLCERWEMSARRRPGGGSSMARRHAASRRRRRAPRTNSLCCISSRRRRAGLFRPPYQPASGKMPVALPRAACRKSASAKATLHV